MMNRRLAIVWGIVFAASLLTRGPLAADLVTVNFLGETSATAAGRSDSDDRWSLNSHSVESQAGRGNSRAVSNVSWVWGNTQLRASSLLSTQMRRSDAPRGSQIARSEFEINFQLSALTEVEWAGLWGFNNTTGGNDSHTVTLLGSQGVISSQSTRAVAGLNREAFGERHALEAGNYTLRFTSAVDEVINTVSTRQGSWELTRMSFSRISIVPEPQFPFLAMTVLCGGLLRWNNRRETRRGSL